ncbi:MAG: amidase family protein [Planctomycetota bacterium]|nr:amidase family protein [Planctomycetota bacterium]
MTDLKSYSRISAFELVAKVQRGEVSPVQTVQLAIDAASRTKSLNAFVELNEDMALEQAVRVRKRMADGEPLMLPGVPIAVKANICVSGMTCDCASGSLSGYRAPYDATAVRLLKDAGAVVVGTTNMDEFGMGSSSGYSIHGAVCNPFDTDLCAGGSSGGSAAVVSAGVVPLALGSDTGGSVRQPAALCGIHGLMLPYGSVSRKGLVAFASSLDQIGFLSRSPQDAELISKVVAKPDPQDASMFAGDEQRDFDPPEQHVRVTKTALSDAVEKGVRDVFGQFVGKLKADGWRITVTDEPYERDALSSYYVLAMSEAFTNLARYDGLRYGIPVEGREYRERVENFRTKYFGPEVKRRIMCGAHALSEGYYDRLYAKASKVRGALRKNLVELERRHGPLLTPTSPVLPFEHRLKAQKPSRMYECDLFTVFANLCGAGSASFPAGFSGKYPVGAMVTSCAGSEFLLRSCRQLARYGCMREPAVHA